VGAEVAILRGEQREGKEREGGREAGARLGKGAGKEEGVALEARLPWDRTAVFEEEGEMLSGATKGRERTRGEEGGCWFGGEGGRRVDFFPSLLSPAGAVHAPPFFFPLPRKFPLMQSSFVL